MLFDEKPDFGLPLLQFARFLVVLVLCNTPVEPQIEESSQPLVDLIVLTAQGSYCITMKSRFRLVPGSHVCEQGHQ